VLNFRILTMTARKLERAQKFDEAGGSVEREGTLARKPLDLSPVPWRQDGSS